MDVIVAHQLYVGGRQNAAFGNHQFADGDALQQIKRVL